MIDEFDTKSLIAWTVAWECTRAAIKSWSIHSWKGENWKIRNRSKGQKEGILGSFNSIRLMAIWVTRLITMVLIYWKLGISLRCFSYPHVILPSFSGFSPKSIISVILVLSLSFLFQSSFSWDWMPICHVVDASRNMEAGDKTWSKTFSSLLLPPEQDVEALMILILFLHCTELTIHSKQNCWA